MKDYQKMLDTLTNVPTGNGFVGDFSKYRESLLSLQELVDKEKPMKIDSRYESDGTEDGSIEIAKCPLCGKEVWNDCSCFEKPDYCPHCGKHLDWEGKK